MTKKIVRPAVYRQGDVALVGVPHIPQGMEQEKYEDVIVLADSHATGHSHYIENVETVMKLKGVPALPSVLAYGDGAGQRFLQVVHPVVLQHCEHDPISIPAGDYSVRLQREHTPVAPRRVAD